MASSVSRNAGIQRSDRVVPFQNMTRRRIHLLAAASVLLPSCLAFAQSTTNPYETQYLDPSAPRLRVEPRPTPAPTRFRYQPQQRTTDYETIYETPSSRQIERPGGAPKIVTPPSPPPEAVQPAPEEPPRTEKRVTKRKVEPLIQREPEPRVVREPEPREPVKTLLPPVKEKKELQPPPAPQPKTERVVQEEPSKPETVVAKKEEQPKPQMRVVAPARDTPEEEVEEAREVESESVSRRDSLAIVTDDDGSFRFERLPVRVTVDLRNGYDSNVFTEPDIPERRGPNGRITQREVSPEGSMFTNISARALYEFGTPRTQGAFDISGGYSYYYDRSGDPDDFDLRFGGQLTHKVSPKLTLRASTYTAYEVQPDYGLVGGNNRRSGSYFYTNSELGANYTWTRRFSTDTYYRPTSILYDKKRDSEFEDRVEQTFGNAFRFLVLPTTVAVAEYRLLLVDYLNKGNRDSISNFLLVGVDHSFSARLSGSARAGAEYRQTSGDQFSDQISPYFEGNLRYAFGERTNAELRLRYGLEQSDVTTDSDREVIRLGIAATHGWTARISNYFTLDYNHSTYEEGTNLNEDTIDTTIGVRYTINRNFSLELAYLFTEVLSNDKFREYTRNQTFASVRMQF